MLTESDFVPSSHSISRFIYSETNFCLQSELFSLSVLGRPKRNQTPDNESMDTDVITTLPCACENVYHPVCGSDAKTYPNPCVAR